MTNYRKLDHSSDILVINPRLPVPILVYDMRDLHNLSHLQVELILKLSDHGLFCLGILFDRPAQFIRLESAWHVVFRIRLPAEIDWKHSRTSPPNSNSLLHQNWSFHPTRVLLLLASCYDQVAYKTNDVTFSTRKVGTVSHKCNLSSYTASNAFQKSTKNTWTCLIFLIFFLLKYSPFLSAMSPGCCA